MMTPVYSMEEYRHYMLTVMNSKNTIGNLVQTYENKSISEIEFKSTLAKIWIPLTSSFIDKYGKEMVPFDVQIAINDVEVNALKINTTKWPAKLSFS